jgi:hypothetical protein
MNSPEDSRLRMLFAKLREEDRSAAPPFGQTAAAATALPRRVSLLRISLVAAPFLGIAVILAVRPPRSTNAIPRELADWSSPTAFLLETPGKRLLNQTPRLGEPLIQALRPGQDGPK